MRRSLRCLLVGVLVFSLSIDTARACWYLRHAHRGSALPACPPVQACGGWTVVSDVPVATWADPCRGPTVVCAASPDVEMIGCGAAIACAGEVPTVVVEQATIVEHAPLVGAPQPTPSAVVEPAAAAAVETITRPAPTPALPVEEVQKPVAVAPVAPSESFLPELQPVEPASATEPVEPAAPAAPIAAETPAVEPEAAAPDERTELSLPETTPLEPAAAPVAPAIPPAAESATPETPADAAPTEPASTKEPAEPAAPVTEPVAAAEQAEENLFETVDTPASEGGAAEPAAAAEESPFAAEPADEPAAEAVDAQAQEDEMPDEAAAAGPAAEEPATEEPSPEGSAAEDTATEEPAAEKDAAPASDDAPPFSNVEPARRWIDATGRYATVGTLVWVSEGEADIQKPDGRTVRVPLERLSQHDRDYAAAAQPRLLAGPQAPQPSDTAGL